MSKIDKYQKILHEKCKGWLYISGNILGFSNTDLEKDHSDLKIPFFLYGEKNDNYVIIRGKITKECIEFGDEI